MPNHVHITLTAVGDAARIRSFMDQAKGTRKPNGNPPEVDEEYKECAFEFDRLVPLPEAYSQLPYSPYGYDMECETWGTKWGAYRVQEPTQKRDTEVTYNFTCAWAAPKLFFEKLSQQWPDLLFVVSYGGEGPCLGRFSLHKGEYEGVEEGDYHTAPDYDENNEDEDYEEAYSERYEAWEQQYRISHGDYVLSLL